MVMDVTARNGVKTFYVSNTSFECPPRYEFIKSIGQGAYGIVCSAKDMETGELVAIKKVPGVADELDCKRMLREMRLLRHFRHENVISMRDIYVSSKSTARDFPDVYTVTELMDTDLHRVISSGQELIEEHIQFFACQILQALNHIHGANVIHRDLKPSNILLNGNCDLKICDFGLAKENATEMTIYVMTRWYRAPEIVLSGTKYSKAVDMWSVGCIIIEMILKRPLFQGRDYIHQLDLVFQVIGSPTEEEIQSIGSESSRQFIRKHLMNRPRKSMDEIVPGAHPLLKDLLDKILVFDAQKRISVEEALAHPYLQSLRPEEEDVEPAPRFVFEYDHEGRVNKEVLKRAIWQEALLYNQAKRM